ncbi:hypothetical protein [Antarcticimicrobium sediminis]|uniref:Phosphotransferase enzyme family protein n=1 Tax=Antarcticimicrobium sediminis TaxID=2546227 RepID=A0A4R5EIJ7_9RHOB|nr:hypothetical protein [Antarcticimicrobium sediminis]TDE34365.1 hypothetical protein E1B25_19865 [Antarcticimicrobium sediminis]
MAAQLSRTAEIRAVATQDPARAEAMLESFIAGLFDIPVTGLKINYDQYSLNSLNGFFRSGDNRFFFKFHQEEGEEQMRGEYYRADILARAGLPVDQPVHMSTLPGEQLLIYTRRADPRFSDVLLELDQSNDAEAIARACVAEADLDAHILSCAKDSLVPITPAQSAAEPIHRLFHERMIDQPDGRYPGGRLARFYVGRDFLFPGELRLGWDEIATARPVIGGIEHMRSLSEMFDLAHSRYAPEALADAGGIVAHGDAHNANVWYERAPKRDHLAFFDPAFAGDKVPALLAEVKSTFHNIFAHPFWLYNPEIAVQRYHAQVRLEAGRLFIDTDWALSTVRRALLETKARRFWKPWLAHLADRELLPTDWEEVLRIGLFLSPMLVMNLNAGEAGNRHNPTSSAIGLAVALAAGSAPVQGQDMFTEFFDQIRP